MFGFPKDVYPIGRLDADSEGLLLLSDEPELIEGRNRQVRRMTAAIGHPTLRLIRVKIDDLELSALPAGEWQELDWNGRDLVLDPR